MPDLRSSETGAKYRAYRAAEGSGHVCHLCAKEPVETFTYWKVIRNDFPYDKVAKQHDMLVPLRHAVESDLTDEEKAELYSIKEGYVNEHYSFVLEPTEKAKTIPDHYHLHLIVLKD